MDRWTINEAPLSILATCDFQVFRILDPNICNLKLATLIIVFLLFVCLFFTQGLSRRPSLLFWNFLYSPG